MNIIEFLENDHREYERELIGPVWVEVRDILAQKMTKMQEADKRLENYNKNPEKALKILVPLGLALSLLLGCILFALQISSSFLSIAFIASILWALMKFAGMKSGEVYKHAWVANA